MNMNMKTKMKMNMDMDMDMDKENYRSVQKEFFCSQDRKPRTGQLGKDSWNRTVGTGQGRQDISWTG
jgi:hypothetical protein